MAVRLFVGNLAYGVTEDEVRELFSAAGTVSQVRVPTDRETGKPRGFAFVDFGDRPEAEEAIRRFNQQVFRERPLVVNEARARESRPAGQAPVRPRPAPRPSWSGSPPPPAEEDGPPAARPKRTFGPDATARDKRKQKGRAAREERRPKGPLQERRGGQLFFHADFEDDEDDQGLDNFALWAREDAKNQDEE